METGVPEPKIERLNPEIDAETLNAGQILAFAEPGASRRRWRSPRSAGRFAPAAPAAAPKPPASLPATSWILVDAESGDVLAAHDPTTAYPIASATKLMTYYVAAEQLRPEPGDRRRPVRPGARRVARGPRAGRHGDDVRDALYGLMVPSGNDAALTLALAVSGSESDFVSRMNAAADELGLAETEYLDPIGLNSGNVSSARDLVDLAIELREQDLFREIVDTPRITLRSTAEPIRIENRNALVLEEPFIDGIKTGTTVEAGYVLVGSGTQNGRRASSRSVLGSPDEASRDSATLELMDYGFSLYGERQLWSSRASGLGSRRSPRAGASRSVAGDERDRDRTERTRRSR